MSKELRNRIFLGISNCCKWILGGTCICKHAGFYIGSWLLRLQDLFLLFIVSKISCYAIYLTNDRASHSILKINDRNLSPKNQGWKECPCYPMIPSCFGRLQQCLLSREFLGYCTCLIQIFREEVNLTQLHAFSTQTRHPRYRVQDGLATVSQPKSKVQVVHEKSSFSEGGGIKCPNWTWSPSKLSKLSIFLEGMVNFNEFQLYTDKMVLCNTIFASFSRPHDLGKKTLSTDRCFKKWLQVHTKSKVSNLCVQKLRSRPIDTDTCIDDQAQLKLLPFRIDLHYW